MFLQFNAFKVSVDVEIKSYNESLPLLLSDNQYASCRNYLQLKTMDCAPVSESASLVI